MFFDSYWRLISGRKTRHWAASPPTSDMFYNISQFPKILSLKSFGNSCTKFVMLDIKYRFTCGDSDLSKIVLKCQNVMTRIVWKIYFALYSSNDNSTSWKKYQFWLKNVSSFKKQLIGRVESFLELNFELNQGYKIVLIQNHLIWNF